MEEPEEQKDGVDKIIGQWGQERPELAVDPMGVFGRISRLAQLIEPRFQAVFEKYGLGRGEFDVLATLRRSGPPYTLTPTALYRSMMVSSGGMTNRLDRLEVAGFVRRIPDPADRRGTLVELTEKGFQAVDQAVEAHVQNETQMLSCLDPGEQEQLAALLRKLLLNLE